MRYFHALQLRDGEPSDETGEHYDPHSQSRKFTTSLPGQVDGDSTMFRNQVLGLFLFSYMEREPNAEPARVAYPALQERLTDAFGDPAETWGPPNEPACLWRPGPLLLEMHCFQRWHSGLMIGPTHAQRTVAIDAAAIHRQQTAPHRFD